MEATGEMARRSKRVGGEVEDLALSKVEGGFGGFEKTRLVGGGDGEAVLDDVNCG